MSAIFRFVLGWMMVVAAAGNVHGQAPFIEFSGMMFGTDAHPELQMGETGGFAYTRFYDSVFSATNTNMNFLDGENPGNLTLHIGDTALGQAQSFLTGFAVINPAAAAYHDTRVYTGADFSLQWNGNPLVSGGSFVDVDVTAAGTFGGATATVGATQVANGKDGADLVDEFNSFDENNTGQWFATFETFNAIVQDAVGEYEVTLRLEPMFNLRQILNAAVPGVGGFVDFSAQGVQFNFASVDHAAWGGDNVTVNRESFDPGGDLPDGVFAVNNGEFWIIRDTLDSFIVDIEFDFDPEDFGNPEDIVVLKRETGSDPWELVPSELVDGENRIRVTGQTSFSEWNLAVVPEPRTYALIFGFAAFGFALFRRTGRPVRRS